MTRHWLTRFPAADHVPGPPGRMTSAAARNLPELLVHSPGVREGIPLLGGSISRSSGAATELPRALAPPESARAHRSAQMARARRPEARGDPPIAIGSCSNFAARPAGVKLRARLPSQRVAAHNLPRHRLALSGRGRSAASRAGGHGPCWSHGAVRPRCAAAASTRSRPVAPSTRTHARSCRATTVVHPRPLPLCRQVTR